MFQMMGVFAEFGRAMIQERVRAGLARPQAKATRQAEARGDGGSSLVLAPAARLSSLPAKRADDFVRVQGHALAFSLRPADARREARDLEHLGPDQLTGSHAEVVSL